MIHWGVSTASTIITRVSRPGMHSARLANSARRPALATASASIITPQRRARSTGTPVCP